MPWTNIITLNVVSITDTIVQNVEWHNYNNNRVIHIQVGYAVVSGTELLPKSIYANYCYFRILQFLFKMIGLIKSYLIVKNTITNSSDLVYIYVYNACHNRQYLLVYWCSSVYLKSVISRSVSHWPSQFLWNCLARGWTRVNVCFKVVFLNN